MKCLVQYQASDYFIDYSRLPNGRLTLSRKCVTTWCQCFTVTIYFLHVELTCTKSVI
jgi:hypothetical protein